jgi:hypothetical protein
MFAPPAGSQRGAFFLNAMSLKNTLYLTAVLFHLISCQTPPNSSSTGSNAMTQFEGQWINTDFCARVKKYGSVLEAINRDHRPYAYAFYFDPQQPDSIVCYEKEKQWKVPVQCQADTMTLRTPEQKNLYLIAEPSINRMTVIDATGASTYSSQLERSDNTQQHGYRAFEARMNQYLLGGAFQLKGQSQTVYWSSNGQIKNWPAYSHYELCTGGGCFVTGGMWDVMQLQPADSSAVQLFAYKMSPALDTLSLYSITEKGPQQAAVAGPLKYQFIKKK